VLRSEIWHNFGCIPNYVPIESCKEVFKVDNQ